MKIIGFNFSKIGAEKSENIENANIENNVKFTKYEKEKLDLLKEEEIIKAFFIYSLIYNHETKDEKKEKKKLAEVSFEGNIVLALKKEELKEFEKTWGKEDVPKKFVVPLYNAIFRRCTIKAVPLQEELNIPSPFLKIPQGQ